MVLNTLLLNSIFSFSRTKLTFKTKLLQIILVVIVAIVGDCLVDLFTSHQLLKCISDNSTHLFIAVISWMFIEELDFSVILFGSPLLCGMMASFVDLDHFVAARSFTIHEATSLSFRPILHWTTLPVTFFVFLVILALAVHSVKLYKFAWFILTAFGTHHLRDGYRRGIWIHPLPSIPPFPYVIYLIGLVAIMLSFNFVMYHPLIMNCLQETQRRDDLPVLQTKFSKIQTV